MLFVLSRGWAPTCCARYFDAPAPIVTMVGLFLNQGLFIRNNLQTPLVELNWFKQDRDAPSADAASPVNQILPSKPI